MTTQAFHHVALNCKDIKAIERFYTGHFGFKRSRFFDLGESTLVFIKLGDTYLELFEAEGGSALATPEGDGHHQHGTVRHLAFKVDDVDAKLAELGDAVTVTLGPLDFDGFIPGWRTVWVADPEGNIIEISQGYQDDENPPPLA
jgi:glyoxylase I family protein